MSDSSVLLPDNIADHDRHTGPDVIGMVDYGDIEYSDMALTRYVTGSWQEDIVAEMIKQMRAGQVSDLIYCSSREHAEWCLVVDICLDCELAGLRPGTNPKKSRAEAFSNFQRRHKRGSADAGRERTDGATCCVRPGRGGNGTRDAGHGG